MSLLGFFKKREKNAFKHFRTNELVYETQTFNIGKTEIKLTFEDDTKFVTTVQGEISQYVSGGNDSMYSGRHLVPAQEPMISEAHVTSSLLIAQRFLRNLHGLEQAYYDNPYDMKETKIGKVKKAAIGNSYPFESSESVAKIVPRKQEEIK